MSSKRKIVCVFSCLFAISMVRGEALVKDPVADLSERVGRPEIENPGWSGITLAPGVTLGGLFEVSALYEKADEESSDINVDTVEFTMGAALREDLNAEVVFLWEEGDEEDIVVDSAVIEYGGTDEFPLVLGFGRMYLGFGNFTSAMITDPLTLELGEIRSMAATAFYEEDLFAVRATVFDGELDNADSIENAAVWLSFSPTDILTLGFSAVTDIGEGGYADDINDVLAEGGSYDKTAGISAFISLELDKVTVSAEYLCAAEDMKLTSAEGEVSEWRPQAWFIELGYAFADAWNGILRYEGSRDFMPETMPEKQFGGTLSYTFNEFATLSAEYLFGQFDADVDDRHIATLQLAVAF